MNIDAFKRTRDLIAKQPPEAFYMEDFMANVSHPCGTAFCIAGWVCVDQGFTYDAQEEIWERPNGEVALDWRDELWNAARLALEIDEEDADHVFHASWREDGMSGTTQAEALEYLDKVIEEGSVYV